MAGGVNGITKIGIIVVRVILGFITAYKLYICLTNGQDFAETKKIISLITIGLSLTLCVLAFWGAYTENSCLCYISLVFCAVLLIVGIWTLIECFIGNTECNTDDYIVNGVTVVIFGVMVVAVYMFIQSIK